jgi:hypothetical protein
LFSKEVLNGGAAAGRVTFANDFLKVAVQRLNNSITYRSIPCPRASRRLRWKSGFDPNETSGCALLSGCQTALLFGYELFRLSLASEAGFRFSL